MNRKLKITLVLEPYGSWSLTILTARSLDWAIRYARDTYHWCQRLDRDVPLTRIIVKDLETGQYVLPVQMSDEGRRLLEQTLQIFGLFPDHLNMDTWVGPKGIDADRIGCGTVGCIGGTMLALKLRHISLGELESRIAKTPEDFGSGVVYFANQFGMERQSAERLFLIDGWPTNFQERYRFFQELGLHQAMAEVTIRRAHYFLRTGL